MKCLHDYRTVGDTAICCKCLAHTTIDEAKAYYHKLFSHALLMEVIPGLYDRIAELEKERDNWKEMAQSSEPNP